MIVIKMGGIVAQICDLFNYGGSYEKTFIPKKRRPKGAARRKNFSRARAIYDDNAGR